MPIIAKILDKHMQPTTHPKINFKVSNDTKKFEQSVSLLSEELVRDIAHQLSDGRINQTQRDQMFQYSEYSMTVMSAFSNPRINEAFVALNQHFSSLHNFIALNFFYDGHSQYVLYPDLRKDPNTSIQWHKYFDDLQQLVVFFERSYKSFLILCKSLFENQDLSNEALTFSAPSGVLVYGGRSVTFALNMKPYYLLKLLTSEQGRLFTYPEIINYFGDLKIKIDKKGVNDLVREIKDTCARNGVEKDFLFCNKGYSITK